MKSKGLPNLLIPLLIGATVNSCKHDAPASVTPNIIVFLTDDQGWGDLSIHGNTNLSTPNIDKIAINGAQFTHFYVCAVCSPTRAEFLTGRYHPRLGVHHTSEGGERMNLDETTLAEIFRDAGYATAAFGKWHNGMQYPYHPNGRGFDEFYGFCSGHWGDYFSPPLEHNGKIVQGDGFLPDDLTSKAIAFMEKNRDKPFLLYIPFNTPHSPYQVPDPWWDRFKDKELEMTADGRYMENVDITHAALAMCENIDWNVGRVLDKLSELNLNDNTIVLFFNDNGPNSFRWNGGMKGIKASTDEGGVRSPLFINWPGVIKPGLVIDEIAGVIDLLPTLTELVGIPCKTRKPLDGMSLKPLLLNQPIEHPGRLIFNHWKGRLSVRSQQYRLDHQGKLFDMIVDPGQYNDISGRETGITQEFLNAAEQWKADVYPEISSDERKFPVGHPDFIYTQLPARDGLAHGGIVRSNKSPNSTYYTNWTNSLDKITWDVEVLSEGLYDVEIYYTCPAKDIGAEFKLTFGNSVLKSKITEPHDPPLRGMENDRILRTQSYVKDFKPLEMGTIHLEKGSGELSLQATDIPGTQVMDFRLMMFTRKDEK